MDYNSIIDKTNYKVYKHFVSKKNYKIVKIVKNNINRSYVTYNTQII